MNRIDAHGLKFQDESSGRFYFAESNSWREQNERPPFRNMMSSEHFPLSNFGDLRDDKRHLREIQTDPSASAEPQRPGRDEVDAGIRHGRSGRHDH